MKIISLGLFDNHEYVRENDNPLNKTGSTSAFPGSKSLQSRKFTKKIHFQKFLNPSMCSLAIS